MRVGVLGVGGACRHTLGPYKYSLECVYRFVSKNKLTKWRFFHMLCIAADMPEYLIHSPSIQKAHCAALECLIIQVTANFHFRNVLKYLGELWANPYWVIIQINTEVKKLMCHWYSTSHSLCDKMALGERRSMTGAKGTVQTWTVLFSLCVDQDCFEYSAVNVTLA